jgi:hypothetical protein
LTGRDIAHDRLDLGQVGDKDHLKVFADQDAARQWFGETTERAWRLSMQYCPNFLDAQPCKFHQCAFSAKNGNV